MRAQQQSMQCIRRCVTPAAVEYQVELALCHTRVHEGLLCLVAVHMHRCMAVSAANQHSKAVHHKHCRCCASVAVFQLLIPSPPCFPLPARIPLAFCCLAL
jgi:hypothetical protein